MATSIGDLALKLSASPANLVAGLSTGEKRLNQFGSAVDKKMGEMQKSFSKPLGDVKMPGLDAIKGKIDGINASAEKLGKGASGMGKGISSALGGVAAGLGMGGSLLTPGLAGGIAAAGAVKVGMDFEKSMSRVKALTGATGEEFDALRQLALKLGRETEFSASQAAEGMSSFALSGFKAKAILDVMTPSVRLASAGMIDIGKSAEISAIILRAMGLEESKLGKVTDVLTFAMTNALTDMTQLSDAFKYVAPTAKMAGLSIEETTAAIMMLSDQGIQGSEAGTVLRNMLKKSSDQSDEARRMMEMLNITFHDAKGNFRGFGVILDDLNRKFAEMKLGDMQKLEILGTMFEIRAGTGFAALLDKGGKYNDLVQRIAKEHVGLATKISGIQIDNLWGDLKIFWSSMQDVGIKFFDSINGPLRAFVQGFNNTVLALGRGFVSVAGFVRPVVEGVLEIGSAMSGVLGFLAKVAAGVGLVKLGMVGLTATVAALGAAGRLAVGAFAFFTSPLSLALGGILALVEATVGLEKAAKGVSHFFDVVGKQTKRIAADLWESIRNPEGRLTKVEGKWTLEPDIPEQVGEMGMGDAPSRSRLLGSTPRGVETAKQNTESMLSLQALLMDTDSAIKKQLASVRESIASTTELTDGATLLEKSWHSVTTATKDFAGVLDQMKRLGATEDQMKPIKALQEQVRQAMLSEKLLGEKSRLFADTRTPAETFKAQLADLEGLFDKGILDADLYTRSLAKLSEGFVGAGDAAKAMREATMSAGPAILRGSAEAISITQRARFEDRSGGDRGGAIAQALEKLRKEQEAQTNVGKARREDARKFHEELKQLLKGDRLGK